MQTFLPYNDFERNASVLDNKRLGKQRVEAYTILRVLAGEVKGWANHPAVRMWKGCESELFRHLRVVCREWIYRGYKDAMLRKSLDLEQRMSIAWTLGHSLPTWLGREPFHLSHQSNLIRKDPAHYGPLFPGVPDNLPYVWPTNNSVKEASHE